MIVFITDARYQRVDPKTGEFAVRNRDSGHAIWHFKGEHPPKLVNVGQEPIRSLMISFE